MAGSKRQLAAVMFTDMVGFTTLMQTNEHHGRQLRSRFVEVMESHHAQHGGEIVQWFGDGALSMFASSLGAVRCGIAAQRDLRAEPAVDVRLGLHVGDVMVEETGLLGDAVNLASRIESFAVPGAVFVSDAIHDQVKNQADLAFVDLGAYRLKNVGRPYRILAVDAPGLIVPPTGHLEGKGQRALMLGVTLPDRSTPVVGRAGDLSMILAAIEQSRLVTLTGPGGIGKTTLAIEAARVAEPTFDAIAFVALASVVDHGDVFPAIADALDVKQAEERPELEGIIELLGKHRVLLVLDNLEQVIAAAPTIRRLVDACPNVHILATSRGPLRVRDERPVAIPPLGVPGSDDADVVVTSAAAELLVDAARRTNPGYEPRPTDAPAIAAICRRLDGLPLALELAAARLRLMSLEELAGRLGDTLGMLTSGSRDTEDRHRTLRATIEWSHSLLNADERVVFRRLSTFAGGATIEAIEAVCADEGVPPFDALDGLVDQALVERSGGRFSMLQVVAQFARERLDEAGEAADVWSRHAAFAHQVSKRVRDGLEHPGQVEALEEGMAWEADIALALDHLTGLARSGDDDAGELGLRMVGNLWMFWHLRGKNLDARRRALALLEATGSTHPSVGRSGGLLTLGLAQWTLGRIEEANCAWLASYEMAGELGDQPLMARSAFTYGVGMMGIDLVEANRWTTLGSEIALRIGDRWAYAFALGFRAFVVALQGDAESARRSFSEARAIQEEIGDFEGAGFALGGMAFLQAQAGDLGAAAELYERSQASYATIGDRAEEARILGEMAWVYHTNGDMTSARRRFLEAIVAYQDVASVRGIGLALIGLAATDALEGRHDRAVRIAAAAEAFVGEEGIVNTYAEAPTSSALVDASRGALGADAVAADAAGRALSVDAAVQLAQSG